MNSFWWFILIIIFVKWGVIRFKKVIVLIVVIFIDVSSVVSIIRVRCVLFIGCLSLVVKLFFSMRMLSCFIKKKIMNIRIRDGDRMIFFKWFYFFVYVLLDNYVKVVVIFKLVLMIKIWIIVELSVEILIFIKVRVVGLNFDF